MAIEEQDRYQNYTFSKTFTVAGASDNYTQILSESNTLPFNDSVITLSIVCAGLDAPVTLNQFQGNNDIFASMSPIVDTLTNTNVSDVLIDGNYSIKTTLSSFFLGLEVVYGSATTGTITIIGRA